MSLSTAPSAEVRTNREGNTTYDLILPTGEQVVVTWLPRNRLRLDGPRDVRLLQAEMYPGAGGKRFTRVVWKVLRGAEADA